MTNESLKTLDMVMVLIEDSQEPHGQRVEYLYDNTMSNEAVQTFFSDEVILHIVR
jgi:hypothetical protein